MIDDRRVEIFVDGSWLPQDENHAGIGAWGAVIVEYKNDQNIAEHHFSGNLPKNLGRNTNFERIAAIHALTEWKLMKEKRPDLKSASLILHTDQTSIPHAIAVRPLVGKPSPDPLMRQIERMAKKMKVHVEYNKREDDHESMMGIAHHLAKEKARELRINPNVVKSAHLSYVETEEGKKHGMPHLR